MNGTLSLQPLEASFYNQPTLSLAQSLLGCLLIHETSEGTTSGFIVETEAYMGPEDRAAHSFNNRRTKRTEVMFGAPGNVYTYVMHTHCLVNIVSGPVNKPEAVLIRAIEPFSGIDLIQKRRKQALPKNWTNGPGKLTKALAITMKAYGHDITNSPLYISKGFTPTAISSGPRIGIDNSGEAKDYPWRFWITNHPYVSK
ncbi:DNA-3-methyladenine glycosylase [Priestia flexa]|uniref:Putative 3-methyladenine DNA glycosylase n=1 Tax=Priestia flexa TaxID=86664 RepID=A0A8I1SN43_9BACI|nr:MULTISPECIES: DNA-3-methyladenine glycosylase [Bacillaceae]KZB92233.1 3-methyladenine DNA glycosylase [Bacillus sp. VT 712]MBN8251523.1 DNA-3-methyladenine glycosylase [Priestia flexa]MBN8434213.1 DNA-3-methyladenine glycosylase [Priestia flexa]MCA0967003.1 DNA-3-methyladenine glycosylase [Priestia flexa]MCA1201206.1 DNA-3-methyladenine glycosylase [Priestia flexa]